MKISEVRKGEVRCAEKSIAYAGSSLAAGGKVKMTKPDGPDFMEYLTEKDRRQWDRLSDSKKERILKRAERSAAIRETEQQPDETGYIQEGRIASGERTIYRSRYERQTTAEYRRNKRNNPVVLTERRSIESVQDIYGYESGYEYGYDTEKETVNVIAAVPGTDPGRREAGEGPGINTEGTGPTERRLFSEGENKPSGGKGRSSGEESVSPGSESGFSGAESGNSEVEIRSRGGERRFYGRENRAPRGGRTNVINPLPSGGNRIKNQVKSGIQINSVPTGSGGAAGIAASAAKRTAAKISGALREKANQISAGDPAKNLADFEKATDEVKNVTNPIKKIVGVILAVLSLILGPIFFVGILIIILVVVIIFLVAWLISILIPVVTASGPGLVSGSGLMPYYCQQDDRWGSYPFNGNTIYTDGCGMTSMAMIMACLTGDMNIIPPTIVDTGYNTVTSHGAPTGIASVYGITDIEQMGGPSRNDCGVSGYDEAHLLEKIAEGCPVLVSVTGTYLGVSTNGHYFVIYGQGENGVYVYDPATLGRIYQESISNGGSDWNDTIHDAKHIWIFPAPEIRVEGDTNAEKIFRYLVRSGWTEAAAAAAVGNFYQEAGGGGTADINPASYDSGSWGEAGGIAGFTDNGDAGNFTALKNFASQRGKDWTDLQTQCDFLIYQLSHGKWWGAYDTPTYTQMMNQGYSVQHMSYEEFTQLTNVDEAVKAFLCFYEDCGYRMAHYEDVRLPMAQQAYAAWGSGRTIQGGSNEKKE